MKYFFLSALFVLSTHTFSQERERTITFPDVEGFLTLKTDFHIHTVFSDGEVWPTIRVKEAVKDGLDAIALTEHIEYQPWKMDIPHPNRNRSYEIASKAAKAHDLLVIHGTEITRSMPPGHANALFVTDVNELIVEDPLEAYRKARQQGAFIFWNHPNWIPQEPDAIPQLSDFHKQLIQEDLLHGIEVVNDLTFSEEALNIANQNNLTVMGTSDIHGLIDYQFNIADGGHRPICLVFAKERTVDGIKEALFAGRTITWFNDVLAGKKEVLQLLMDASIAIKIDGFVGKSEVLKVVLTNTSDARFFLQNTSVYDFYKNTDIIELLPHSETTLEVLTARSKNKKVPLTFKVLNVVQGYKEYYNLEVQLNQ